MKLFILIIISQQLLAMHWCSTPKVNNFVNKHASALHLSKADLCAEFDKNNVNQTILAAVNRPYESKPWQHYEQHFITAQKINDGRRYLHQHQQIFQHIEHKFGVPAPLIAAIIGIETNYGHNTGQFKALEALLTLSFYYPKRSKFFTNELAQLLRLAQQDNLPLQQVRSSYAGALGIPQFMPSNYHSLGIAAYPGQKLDLFNNHDDAIVSIANFIYRKGWHGHQPIIQNLNKITTNLHDHLQPIRVNKLPMRIKKMLPKNAVGFYQPDVKARNNFAVFDNFFVLQHYNRSPQYVLAVTLLAQKIASNTSLTW